MTRILLGGFLGVLAIVATAGAANAQASRTWVSGVGDDANPCSRTAPCKTFPGAISKTAAGGEINCLDSGGFGAVTITKSITLYCEGVIGGMLAAGQNGVTINGANVVVVLKGLDIDGFNTAGGFNGIRFLQGAALHVEDCIIRNFTGTGILFAPNAGIAELTVKNTTVINNGSGTTGGGIQVLPTASGAARVLIDGATVANNAAGIRGDTAASSGGINIAVVNSTSTGNTTNGIAAISGTPNINIMVDGSTSAFNALQGIRAQGTGATVRLSNSQVTANGTGVAVASGGIVSSYGNNHIDGNSDNGVNPGIIAEK